MPLAQHHQKMKMCRALSAIFKIASKRPGAPLGDNAKTRRFYFSSK